MWRTEYGDRILEGAEAIVFAKTLSSLLDEAIMGTLDDYQLGVDCFDNLTFGQRISVLATIGNGLLRKDVRPVKLTAVLEAGIAAVFEHLKNKIIIEIDEPELGTDWRELLVAARKEMEGENIPEPTCDDLDEWYFEVQELANGILWNVDYEDAQLYIDFPPKKSKRLKNWAGIPDNYYLAIADELTDEEAQARIKELRKLCNSVIKAS